MHTVGGCKQGKGFSDVTRLRRGRLIGRSVLEKGDSNPQSNCIANNIKSMPDHEF